MTNLTFSPKVAFCSLKNFNSGKFLSDVNNSLSDLDFLTDEPPPPIPIELFYEPPLFKIKKMASKIGNILEKAKVEKLLKDDDVISSFINSNFDFSTNYKPKSDDIDPVRTIFDFISKNRKSIHFASPMYPANDTLIVVSLMTPKSANTELKRQIHQCFVALGSNTFHQLVNKFICPICKITEVLAGPHCAVEQLEIGKKIIYNFDQEFDQPLSSILKQINCCGNYKSKGGCTHLIVFNGAFAVHNDNIEYINNENDNSNYNENDNSNYNENDNSNYNENDNSNYNENDNSNYNENDNSNYNENDDSNYNENDNSNYNENDDSNYNENDNSNYNENDDSNYNENDNSNYNENDNSNYNENDNSNYNENDNSNYNENDNSNYNENDNSNYNENDNSNYNENDNSNYNENDNNGQDNFNIYSYNVDNFKNNNGNDNDHGSNNDNNNLNNNDDDNDISKASNKSEDLRNMVRTTEKSIGNITTLNSDDSLFPIEIDGKGANPPSCILCKIRPGSVVVKVENSDKNSDENKINLDEDDDNFENDPFFPFHFYCKKCFREQHFDQEHTLIIDLTDHFFTPS